MKHLISIVSIVLISLCAVVFAQQKQTKTTTATTVSTPQTVNTIHLTKAEFLIKVFDFEKNKDWQYLGSKPCLIDFYADWCGPCKKVAPILEELASEYGNKIIIYKINTDKEKELAAAFGIRSIPSLLFVPMTGSPQMALGALPKETLQDAIEKVLLVK
ncbi:MAG: thioredoxin [Paludibacter sp.]|jgi:thioredoxin|nr:thioredoxin [Paludibacter sp.]